MNTVEPIRDKMKILAIKGNLKGKNPRDYLLFSLGINLALRISDLLLLKVKDVLARDGSIKDYLYIREKKTKKDKRIKLNKAAKEALEYYFSKENITNPDAYLFTSKRSGKPLERIRGYQLVKKWTEEVGLTGERYGTHSLRKTWGYQARKKGIPIEIIQEKLGHSNTNVTRRYIGITQEEVNGIEDEVCL